ncbi:MAG: BTAD domain-containing putative transcriptional regulator [Actinomycetota bacterium]
MLDFRVLGPVEVHRDGEQIPLGGRQQRALLAALALRANELVSAERLIEELWPEDPPDTADHLVHVYVSRLRKAMGDDDHDVLATRQPGYELAIPTGGRDLDRFEQHLAQAKTARDAGELDGAATALRDALALWRGPALADLVSESFARADAARLNELRLGAIEDLVEVELARGDAGLVPQLRSLVEEHPLRERLRGFLMVALYREGRQAEALQAYEDARAILADELGIDPSQELQDLYRRVLNQDPELRVDRPVLRNVAPSRTVIAPDGDVTGERPTPGTAPDRRRLALLGGLGIALVAVLVATIPLVRSSGGTGADDATAEVVRLSADGGEVLERLPVDVVPSSMAIDGSVLWIADRDARTITRLDTRTGEERTISPGGVPYALEAAEGRLWVMDPFGGTVTLIDGESPARIIKRSAGPLDAVYAFDSLWVLDGIDESVLRIDPTEGRTLGRIRLERDSGPIHVAATADALWVLNGLDATLSRIDPDSGLDANAIPLFCPASATGCRPFELAAFEDEIWVTIEHPGVVELFDGDGEQRNSVDGLTTPSVVAASADGSWVMLDEGSRLMHLDVNGQLAGGWDPSQRIVSLAAGGRAPWVSLALAGS